MALRTTVNLVDPDKLGAIHFIAIGGAGMSGIAEFYHQMGIRVTGCDRCDSATLRMLASHDIATHIGHDPAHLDGIDTVVVSSAIRPDNPELRSAQRAGLRIWHRSAALASLMIGRLGIAVSGTHGKTTTSAMIATLLQAAGCDPSYVIGAPIAATGASCHVGAGDPFVVEADESDGSFLQYPTKIAVVTSVEPDHLDNWGDADSYARGFQRFVTSDLVETVVVNIDDAGGRLLAEYVSDHASCQVITYGESPDADYRIGAIELEGTDARCCLEVDERSWDLHLQVPGRYNLANAAAAFTVGRLLGCDEQRLLDAAASFQGTLRRFQLVASCPIEASAPVRIYDDYAHHPTELKAALTAAAKAADAGRLIACFQPHLYTRTRDFADEFAHALALADRIVLTDIYPAREDPIEGVSTQLILDVLERDHAEIPVDYCANKADLPGFIASIVQPGDVVMTLGAGDVTLVGPILATQLRGRC